LTAAARLGRIDAGSRSIDAKSAGKGVEIMRSIVLGLLMMATAAGCAAARNTPAQELAWERWGRAIASP
jgi:hypothetical protein